MQGVKYGGSGRDARGQRAGIRTFVRQFAICRPIHPARCFSSDRNRDVIAPFRPG